MFNPKPILYIVILLLLSGQQYAEAVVNDAGAINAHTMDILKQNQQLQKEEQNFQEVKNKKKFQPPPVPDAGIKAEPIVKAKLSEYETKGVYIDKIVFSPSQILTESELEDFSKQLAGRNLFIDDINAVIEKINNLYAERGYVTARAILPEQTIEDGVLNVKLIEGKVGTVNIRGNKWTRDGYIAKRLNEKPDALFKISVLEQDILNFNRNTGGVELKANLEPGEKPETTDINLSVKESIPFHFTTVTDNAGRSTIGIPRVGFMLSDDSLLGYRDRLTLGTYLTKSSTTPFADYNFPVNRRDGRLGFTFSSSFAQIQNGDYSMFDIKSRSFNYTLYFNQPIIRRPAFELVSESAINYKQATTSFDEVDLYTDKISSLQTGLSARYLTKRGIWYLNQTAYHAFPLYNDASKYFIYQGSLIRLHDFGHNIVGQFRSAYQWSPKDVVPYVDQFQAGGIASVRGYSEGLLIGKTGYLFSGELLFPIAPQKIKIRNKKINFIGKYVKGVFFTDFAAVYPFKGSGPGVRCINSNDYMIGMGPGLRISLPGDATARLYWGFPLMRNDYEQFYHVNRFHFEVTVAPDFDKVLSLRKRRETL